MTKVCVGYERGEWGWLPGRTRWLRLHFARRGKVRVWLRGRERELWRLLHFGQTRLERKWWRRKLRRLLLWRGRHAL